MPCVSSMSEPPLPDEPTYMRMMPALGKALPAATVCQTASIHSPAFGAGHAFHADAGAAVASASGARGSPLTV